MEQQFAKQRMKRDMISKREEDQAYHDVDYNDYYWNRQWYLVRSQPTQNICITFKQCWINVEDVGPTLYKCFTNVLCLLGWAGALG